MAAVGDIISITARGRFLGQLNLNVYWYQLLVWGGAATIANGLAQFAIQVGSPIRALQSAQLLYFELEWKNWSNTAELVRSPYDVLGTAGGEAMAPVNAGKYRLFGFSAVTRSGWKRPGCLSESDVTNGAVLAGAFTRWDAARDGLKAILEPTVGSTVFRLQPVIVGTASDGSKDLARVNPVANCEYDLNTSSQTSRKIGRGA
jgi:hypothetical protein